MEEKLIYLIANEHNDDMWNKYFDIVLHNFCDNVGVWEFDDFEEEIWDLLYEKEVSLVCNDDDHLENDVITFMDYYEIIYTEEFKMGVMDETHIKINVDTTIRRFKINRIKLNI